jgi:hypothetical protein
MIELVKQLPPERKRAVLLLLAEEARVQREARVDYAEAQLRRWCAERELDWDTMSEEERETFVDDLVHEERPCAG